MARLFSRGKKQVSAPPGPLPVAVAEILDVFRRVWPVPVTLRAYTSTFEQIPNWERGSHSLLGGMLLVVDDLIVFHNLEVVNVVPWVTPIARLTNRHFFVEEEKLWTRCAHPTERGEYLNTYWQLQTKVNGPDPDPFELHLRNWFFEQVIACWPATTPTVDELWPPNGELGVGTGWVPQVVERAANGPYPPLSHFLGDHRLESRMPEELRLPRE
jgi:hypothetical protein